ncbi:hypothetical protein SUGI_0578190 [Cryptomeria japonica]|nr:hypothetical protein SUGI_0578190 [Cryptomeria japonica]
MQTVVSKVDNILHSPFAEGPSANSSRRFPLGETSAERLDREVRTQVFVQPDPNQKWDVRRGQFVPKSSSMAKLQTSGSANQPGPDPYLSNVKSQGTLLPSWTAMDSYDPVKNKATIEAMQSWVDNQQLKFPNTPPEEIIEMAVNSMTGLAATVWKGLDATMRQELIQRGMPAVAAELCRQFVGNIPTLEAKFLKKFENLECCEVKYLHKYFQEQFINFNQSGATMSERLGTIFLKSIHHVGELYYNKFCESLRVQQKAWPSVTMIEMFEFIDKLNEEILKADEDNRAVREIRPLLRDNVLKVLIPKKGFGCDPLERRISTVKRTSLRKEKIRGKTTSSHKCEACATKPKKGFFKRRSSFPKKVGKKFNPTCYICKGPHYATKCPQKGSKKGIKKSNMASELGIEEKDLIFFDDTPSESDEECFHFHSEESNSDTEQSEESDESEEDGNVVFSVLMARGSTLGKTKEQELEEAQTQKRELLLKLESFSDGIGVQKQRELELADLQRFIDGLVNELEIREVRRQRRIEELAAEAEQMHTREEPEPSAQGYVPSRREWRHKRMHQLEQVLTEARVELTWLQAEEREDQVKIATDQEKALEEFSRHLYQGEGSSRTAQLQINPYRKGVRIGKTIDLNSGMTEEEEAFFEQLQNRVSEQQFQKFIQSDSSDDEEVPYDRRSKSSFMASTICPTIKVTICFPGIQNYQLMSMLDTGANLNLARWHCFPKGNWEPSRQGINFGGNFRMSHWQCWAPILFPNHSIHHLLFVHTELPDHDLAIGAASMRSWEPYTFAAKEVIFSGNSFPRLINYDCISSKCLSVPIPETYQKLQKRDKTSWIGKKLEKAETELQQIQQEFAETVMSKDLSKMKRDLWCTLPLQKDDSGKELTPVFKANYFLMNKDEQIQCAEEIQKLLQLGHYPAIAQARRNLNRLLRKDSPAWTKEHNNDIQRIKDTCASLPPLHLPGKGEKIVETDASEYCWGAVLKERDATGKEVPVRYASGTFQGAEQRYHSTHKEILAVVKAFEQFELFIHDQTFLVRSDLNNLQSFLNASTKKKVARNRLLRWAEYLTQFD